MILFGLKKRIDMCLFFSAPDLTGLTKEDIHQMSLEIILGITAVVNTVVNILGEIREWHRMMKKKKEE